MKVQDENAGRSSMLVVCRKISSAVWNIFSTMDMDMDLGMDLDLDLDTDLVMDMDMALDMELDLG